MHGCRRRVAEKIWQASGRVLVILPAAARKLPRYLFNFRQVGEATAKKRHAGVCSLIAANKSKDKSQEKKRKGKIKNDSAHERNFKL